MFKEAPTHLKSNLTRILQESYGTVCLINQDTHEHTPRILRFSIMADEPDQRGGAVAVVFFTFPSFHSSEAQQARTFVVKKKKANSCLLKRRQHRRRCALLKSCEIGRAHV